MHAGAHTPTDKAHDRLIIALAISTCAVVSLLQVLGPLLDLVAPLPGANTESLSVLILPGERVPTSENEKYSLPVSSRPTSESTYSKDSESDVEAQDADIASAPVDQRPNTSLRQLVDDAIQANLDRSFRQETARKSQWQKSRSVLYERPIDYPPQLEEPIISDFRFRPEMHVAGLGLTIGSCFIGIPLVGIPVEERTVAFRPIVCAKAL